MNTKSAGILPTDAVCGVPIKAKLTHSSSVMTMKTKHEKNQNDKFREAAREVETDQSEENFDRLVKRISKSPP